MLRHVKSWGSAALLVALGLTVGVSMPRPARPVRPAADTRGHDLMDAVAAVQRRSPRFLISEPLPETRWVHTGTVYLCRRPKTTQETDTLNKFRFGDPRWAGVLCFQGTADPSLLVTWQWSGGGAYLDYGTFVVGGDPRELGEVRAILESEGFPLAPRPSAAGAIATPR